MIGASPRSGIGRSRRDADSASQHPMTKTVDPVESTQDLVGQSLRSQSITRPLVLGAGLDRRCESISSETVDRCLLDELQARDQPARLDSCGDYVHEDEE